jgi:hypothetical protein
MSNPHSRGFVRHPWFIGGGALIAAVIIVVPLDGSGPRLPGTGVLATLLFATAMLVFAFGGTRDESVTARRPLGTTALTLLAAWALFDLIASDLFGAATSAEGLPPALGILFFIDPYLRFFLALIAATQIGRARVVPTPWNWAPAWVVGAQTIPWLLSLIAVTIPSLATETNAILVLGTLDGMVRAGSAVCLGALAIVLADRATRPARGETADGDVDTVHPATSNDIL